MRSILSLSSAALLATCLAVGGSAAIAGPDNSGGKFLVAKNDTMSKDHVKKKVSKKKMRRMKGDVTAAPAPNKGMDKDNPGGMGSSSSGAGGSGGGGNASGGSTSGSSSGSGAGGAGGAGGTGR